jgi:uncharacterized protein (TIGR02147 family)
MDYGRQILTEEFRNRRERNSAYSLRAFSRDLGIGVTSLSDFFADKRQLSKSSMKRVAEALRLSDQQRDFFLSDRTKPFTKKEAEQMLLEEDQFRLIADWYYLAVLNLARIKENKSDPLWIAKRLGISIDEAREALVRLQRMNFLKIEGKKLVRTTQTLATTRDIPSSAIRKHHAHGLRLAESSLLNDSVDLREFSSSTIAINPAKVKQAKEILLKTKLKLTELLRDANPTEVYMLSFQLFPLTKREEP